MDRNSQIKHKMLLQGRKYYVQHLYIISSVLPVKLTTKEINVLSLFMNKGDFSKSTRKELKKELNLSASSLSNYLKILTDKRYIKNNNGVYELNDLIKVKNGRIDYNFILEKQD